VHRDIKPDNIFLCDGDGGELFVKLLDFGIAKSEQHRITSAATTTGAVVGTPYYMSPEQIIGDSKIDARTDIWSLGVVAFEAMTGKRPFDGATIGAITLAIHTTTPRITEHIPDAPEALDQWFAHVCARIPGDRFQSPREAAAALLETVGDLPSSLPRLRVPMPSMVGDAGATSSPNVAPSSDLQLATNLSSSASVHQDTNRRRPVLAVAVGATVLGLAVGLFTIPAWLAPRKPTVVGGATAPVAQRDPPTMTTPSSTAPPQPATSAALPASEVEPTEARAPASVTSAGTANTATQPRAPTSAKAPVKATKPAKPNRTRDDDDIK
jgi:serine/threonine-protein kinase